MKHFLAGPNNTLTHLPDFKLEIGQRGLRDHSQLGGPAFFVTDRKMPDTCVFKKPTGQAIPDRVHIVSQKGIVRSVEVTERNINATQHLFAGVVVDETDVSSNEEAMDVIRKAVAS
jgi:hypothetical protein